MMLLPARCERVATSLNRTVLGDTFPRARWTSHLRTSDASNKCYVQMEQRMNLKFLVKLGKTFTEAYAMLKEVYGNACLSCTHVFEWFKRFKEGR
ncbi:hypothetical protein NQ318_009075 [Aromia moschata]|uniref:Mos1 transposase HTH domain-containing protein n=1 Tax=Aromia moschata TaxID=1265417 RepID=A0AAV8YT52_9CUCU|nr:hypothetical protein NQ318_009075 [Aromia moschata]